MFDVLKDSRIKRNSELCSKFYENNDIILIPYYSLLLTKLSISEYLAFLSEIQKLVKEYKIYYMRKQIPDYLFSNRFIPDISAYEYIRDYYPEELIFYSEQYSCLRYTDIICFIIPKTRQYSAEDIKKRVHELNKRFSLYYYTFTNKSILEKYTSFFCHIFRIYERDINSSQIKEIEASIKEYHNKAKSDSFIIKNSYIAKDFCNTISDIEGKFSYIQLSHFTYEANSDYKIIREEFHFLKHYLQKIVKDENAIINLGKKIEKWDAKVNDEIVEITIAVYDKEHIIRRLLSDNYSLPLYYQTIDELGKDLILNIILETINKKIKKNYDDNRTLLVATEKEFFEYFELCDDVFGMNTVSKAINYLQDSFINQTSFSKIYLFLDDNPVQIFPKK